MGVKAVWDKWEKCGIYSADVQAGEKYPVDGNGNSNKKTP